MVSDPPSEPVRAPDDAELMARVAGGDEAALAEVFDRFAPHLLSLATRILGNAPDGEEVLQEAFIHAWHRADRYDPSRSSLATWLVLITRSRAIDRLRSRRVSERTTEAARHENPSAHESPRAARDVFIRERRERVATAMRDLPAEQRQVVELAYYQGFTQSEIALATGIPLGTVKTRTLLAMKKLRQALRDEIEELL